MPIRVKIIDRNYIKEYFWYLDCIGTVWKVRQDPKRKGWWRLVNHHDADHVIDYRDNERTDLPLFIDKKDCTIVPDKKLEKGRTIRCL